MDAGELAGIWSFCSTVEMFKLACRMASWCGILLECRCVLWNSSNAISACHAKFLMVRGGGPLGCLLLMGSIDESGGCDKSCE